VYLKSAMAMNLSAGRKHPCRVLSVTPALERSAL